MVINSSLKERVTKTSIFDLLTVKNGFSFVFLFVCLREVKNHLPSNDGLSLDDFVLMTLFPQRRISDMESTLESAGKRVQCTCRIYSCV